MENKILEEHVLEAGGSNTAYLLKNPDLFYDTGFKVMRNQKDGSLLECHRLKYNGKIKLVYFTGDLAPFDLMLQESAISGIRTFLHNLENALCAVENNDFLNVACIDNRLEKIFVDVNTYLVKLIYLPLNIPVNKIAGKACKNRIKEQLIQKLQMVPAAQNPEMIKIVEDLSEEGFSAPDRKSTDMGDVLAIPGMAKKYALTEINGSICMPIAGEEFLIGKSADKVNGVIEGNPAISRIHCKMLLKQGKLLIQDMGSANGTFVNGRRLSANECMEVEEGTRIKLANKEFVIHSTM